MDIALLAAALLAGSLLAVQASVNLQLTKAVGTPYGAATLQLSVAAGLLVLLVLGAGAAGAVQDVSGVPAWQLLGGLASPLYITSGILLFPRLGALTAVALFVTGQLFASLGLDVFGLLGVPDRSLTLGIALGAAAVLAGVTVILRGQRALATPDRQPAVTTGAGSIVATGATATGAGSTPATERTGPREPVRVRVGRVGYVLLGLLAGAGLPVQGAVNAKLRDAVEAPLAVALVSFVVATLASGAVLVALLAGRVTPAPALRPVTRMPWWGWLGGACAVAYVTATFMVIPEIGAATTVALTVTGQQVASAVVDSHGLLRMPRRPLTPQRLVGLVLLVGGSALVQLA